MQLKEGIFFDDRYFLIKVLRSGDISEVWLVADTKVSNQIKALKIFTPDHGLNSYKQFFSKEFKLAYDLNHSHVLRPSHFDVCDSSPYLVLPYCGQGSAARLVGNIKEEEAWYFLHDVASGLAYLHEQEPPIIHQDITPNNVLVDHKGKYLITGFGFIAKASSTLHRSEDEAKILYMTPLFSPPERFSKNHEPIRASDIWSLGATLFTLLEGDVPFKDRLGGQAQRNGAEIPEITGNWSPELKKIVTLCLQLETWNRPTAQQLVAWTENHFRHLEVKRSGDKPSEYEPEMVQLQGGTFTMGCTSEQEDDCPNYEKPAHQVTVSDFQICKYEVTQAQWQSVMGSNPSEFKGDSLPVENVSWDDVQDFIGRLNARTGKKYRLPTEAEWEYAARGGNKSRGYKYSGSNNLQDVGWYRDNSDGKTYPVGTKSPNEQGLYDMSGNVWEWCSDWYGSFNSNAQTDPQGPSSGSYRVIRGGGWWGLAKTVRVSHRYYCAPDDRDGNLGFRLACNSK